ncbi:MAG: D-alanyl-D-alanine carboxypeptidase [Hyphococcus sp.]|nr:MAG: D-alanyl-D-alanine carboxypeptidase [Marinicaulis sp.]
MTVVTRCVAFLLLTLALSAGLTAPATANSKYAAYVVHADSGDVLFDRYSNARRYPASLTKMMTLYLLFDEIEAGNLTLKSKLKVSKRASGQPPSKLGVKSGSTITVETAIEALVVKSANDVAVVVAEHISGSEWRFAQKMTQKARSLGMRRTTFRNASGLPNSKQVTTARDMATLGRRVMQDFPKYYPYFSAKSFKWNGRTYSSHNSLVKTYAGADGIKTGYTRRSGFNLVTSAEKNGHRLIGVVLGGRSSRTRDTHMRSILNTGFANIKKKPAMIAALHRKKPAPRLKPTLVARMKQEAPVVAMAETLEQETMMLVTARSPENQAAPALDDRLGALIAAADTDDFNEFERTKMASFDIDQGFIGQGDLQALNEFTWDVQIGAYSTKEMAQTELEEAAMIGKMTGRARAVMPINQADGAILYRARFIQLSEIEAALACQGLKEKKISCFVVSEAEHQKALPQ